MERLKNVFKVTRLVNDSVRVQTQPARLQSLCASGHWYLSQRKPETHPRQAP